MKLSNKFTEYGIDFDKVIGDENFSMLTKMTLVMIQNTEYLTLGTYFQKLTNSDLETLLELCEEAQNADQAGYIYCQAVSDLIVMSQALAQAEGSASQSEAEAHVNVNYLIMIANCVSLERKGLVEIKYDKISFGVDVNHEGVVRLKPGVGPDNYESIEDDDI